MSLVTTERLPLLAAVGLGTAVLVVAVLPMVRDPDVVSSIEVAMATPTAQAEERSDRDKASRSDGAEGKPGAAGSSDTEIQIPGADEPGVDEAAIDKASTSADLKALLKRAPKDERILKKLAKTLAKEPAGLTEALSTLKTLYATSPKTIEDRDLQQIVVRAATGQVAVQDIAFDMMTSKMGSVGPDLLYELSIAANVSGPVKQKSVSLTKRDDVRKLASPALDIALDLRDTSPCERIKLLAQAEKVADKRALAHLTPLQSTKGCGIFRQSDCYECFGNRTELNKTINAINAR